MHENIGTKLKQIVTFADLWDCGLGAVVVSSMQ